jgi:membrane fusion protein, multidrug efflux system
MLHILKEMKSKNLYVILALIMLIIFLFFFFKERTIYTDNAYLDSNVIIIKPEVSGFITEVLVKDNSFVKEGQVIAKIDDKDFQLSLNKAEYSISAVKNILESVKLSILQADYEVKRNNLAIGSAKITLNRASKEFKRSQVLIRGDATSQQELDKKFEVYKLIQNEYQSLEINKSIIELKIKQAMHRIEESEAQLKIMEDNAKLLRIDLENTLIRSKIDGFVSLKSPQVGQFVFLGSSLGYVVGNTTWVIANYKETQLKEIHEGQKAIVKIDAFPDKKIKAIVKSFSPATGDMFSMLPADNATGNFTKIVRRVPVNIEFDKDADLLGLRAGLSCEVWVEVQ